MKSEPASQYTESISGLSGLLTNSSDIKSLILATSPAYLFLKFNDVIQKLPFVTSYRALDNENGCEVSWNTFNLSHYTIEKLSKLQVKLSNHKFPTHKNLVNIKQAWVNIKDKELIIITEILTGNTIKDYLTKLPRPRKNLIKVWGRGILESLLFLKASKSPKYFGLTPQSIHIMSSNGLIKLTDYHLAEIFNQEMRVLKNIEYTAPEILHGVVDEKSDIYNFGMILLEMCTKEAPYNECENNNEVYKKVKNFILPESIKRIKTAQVLNIITKCIGKIESRPSVADLLAHPFFDLNETGSNIVLQGSILKPISSYSNTILIIIRNLNNTIASISFEYNPESDSPESVALEMIENLKLSKKSFLVLANEIQRQLPPRPLNLKIFRFSPDSFEPASALLPKKTPFHVSQKSSCL